MMNAAPATSARPGHSISTELFIRRDIQEVFSFFADASNLNMLTPPWLHFRIVTPAPVAMRVGALIDYRLRVRGIPMRWRSEITEWSPPRRFVDEQRRGPYRWWIHQHDFESRDGGTLVRDHVDYGVPCGALVNRLLVRPDLDRIFAYRSDALRRHFQAAPSTPA